MENKPVRKLSDEQIMEKLREGARRKRPWTPMRVLVTVLFFAIPLGLIAWLIFPRAKPPDLKVIAFDQLAVRGENVTLHAQLMPADPNVENPRLADNRVSFQKEKSPGKPAAANGKEVISDAEGLAGATWSFPKNLPAIGFRAQYQAEEGKRPVFDRGNVFFYPAKSKLLLIEVETTLPADATDWSAVNIHDVKPSDQAVAFLKKATDANYRPVYIAFRQDSVWDYRKVRGWVEKHIARRTFPPGPILARFPYDRADSDAARCKALAAIKEKFSGPVVAFVENGKAPDAYQQLQIKTVTSDGPLP